MSTLKKRTKIVFVLIILILFCFTIGYALEDTKDFKSGYLMGDEDEYLVILTGRRWQEFGSDIVIYSIVNGKKEVFRRDISHLKPWKIDIGDVDGDGNLEIAIGVYKESPLHPIMAKRPFIYNFNGNDLIPKWRGSRLSRPFSDFLLFDVDQDGVCEIVAIEDLADGGHIINSYKWKGFGFEGFLESRENIPFDYLDTYENELYAVTKNNDLVLRIRVFDLD